VSGTGEHAKLAALVARCAGLLPLPMAVVHLGDVPSLEGAARAAEAGLIAPVLAGPQARIRTVAREAGLDLAS